MKTILNVNNETIKKMSFNEIKNHLCETYMEHFCLCYDMYNVSKSSYDDLIDLKYLIDEIQKTVNKLNEYDDLYLYCDCANELILCFDDDNIVNVFDVDENNFNNFYEYALSDCFNSMLSMYKYVNEILNNEILKNEQKNIIIEN